MDNTLLDLRWLLLNNLVHFKDIIRWYKLSFVVSLLIFTFTSIIPIFKSYIPSVKNKKYLLSNITFIISLTVFIIAGRWWGLLPPVDDPDEAQFIAGAMKLLKDPFFWRAVDTGSSGPLNIYPLTLPALFGIRLEYASARVIGLILVIISIISLHYLLQFIYGKSIARLVTFLIAATFATMRYNIHYQSENFSIAILILSLLIICYGYSRPDNDNRLLLLSGFLLGLIPYAKMQAVPIAFSIVIMSLHIIWQKSSTKSQLIRSLSAFGLGLTICSVLVFIYLIAFSIFDDFWKSYIQENLIFYATNGVDINNEYYNLINKFILFIQWGWRPEETKILLVLTGGVFCLILPFLGALHYFGIPKGKGSKTFVFVYYSLGILLASVYAVIKPVTLYLHYLLFLIIPCGFFLGVCLGELCWLIQNPSLKRSLYKLSLILTITLALLLVFAGSFQTYQTVSKNNLSIEDKRRFWKNYRSPLVQTILKYALPGDSLVVWGFAPQLYVDTGMIQGTRDGNIVWQRTPNALQSYYLKRFADDMVKANAHLFVDAVGPKMFGSRDRERHGHEVFPEIARIVSQNYKLVDEVEGVRIYARK